MKGTMLKTANLRTIAANVDQVAIRQYLISRGILSLREQELQGIVRLVSYFSGEQVDLNHVYIGYSMPEISKEFDLLLFDKSHHIINIELKSDVNYAEEKVKKQLINNKYYLAAVATSVKLFTYNSDSDRLYTLNHQNELTSFSMLSMASFLNSEFYKRMIAFKSVDLGDLDQLFNAKSYLVSPFQQTFEFLKGNYTLTHHQRLLQDEMLATQNSGIYAVRTPAGIGKPLMLYDTFKQVRKVNATLLVHVGKLNATQEGLRRHQGWQILPIRQFIKKLKAAKLQAFDYIFVDEAQKLSVKNVNTMCRYFAKNTAIVFLIGDPNQKSKTSDNNNYYFSTIMPAFGNENVKALKLTHSAFDTKK